MLLNEGTAKILLINKLGSMLMMQVWIRYIAKGRNPLETSDSLFVELALKDAFKRASFQEVDSILFKHYSY